MGKHKYLRMLLDRLDQDKKNYATLNLVGEFSHLRFMDTDNTEVFSSLRDRFYKGVYLTDNMKNDLVGYLKEKLKEQIKETEEQIENLFKGDEKHGET